MPRREFLQTTIGAVSGLSMPSFCQASVKMTMDDTQPDLLTKYKQSLAVSDELELFGISRSGSCVWQGLHPFTPDRTLIVPSHAHNDDLVTKLLRNTADRRDRDDDMPSTMAIRRIAQAASFLTQVYRVRKQTEDWARRLLGWLFKFYYNLAQDHHWLAPCSWQGFGERVETRNKFAEWWLILIPEGIEVSSIDGTRLHALITPIYEEVGKPRLPVEFWHFMAIATGLQPKAFGGPQHIDKTWLDISHMGRQSACLAVNQRIAQNLAKLA